MPKRTKPTEKSDERTFDEQAALERPAFLRELWDFLCHNKKWWLAPIVVVLLLVGVVIVLSSTLAAPLIYTLF